LKWARSDSRVRVILFSGRRKRHGSGVERGLGELASRRPELLGVFHAVVSGERGSETAWR
jgi:hypothetical protein